MDQRLSKKLDDLPSNDNEFWKDADVNVCKPKGKNCKHYFKMKNGIEAECSCGVGYYINGPEYKIKKGHIYYNDEYLI